MLSGTTPADLIARSKHKFVLSQARLRPGEIELTLLSLQGSLYDGLRSYLLLHGHAAAGGDTVSLLAALCNNSRQPLTEAEASRITRMAQVCERLSQGEAVTLTHESVAQYQQFVAGLLLRYGVLVVVPETSSQDMQSLRRAQVDSLPLDDERPVWWERPQTIAFGVLLLVLLGVLGTVTTLAPGRSPAQQASPPAPVVSTPGQTAGSEGAAASLPNSTATLTAAARLVPGRTVFVDLEPGEQLALRAQPGTASDNPVRLYLAPRTAVRVLDGPVEVAGEDWWLVRAVNQEGWCRGRFLSPR